jgi:hypothetical protein
MMIQSPPSSRFKAFFAPLTARRQPDGPVTAGKLQNFRVQSLQGQAELSCAIMLPENRPVTARKKIEISERPKW